MAMVSVASEKSKLLQHAAAEKNKNKKQQDPQTSFPVSHSLLLFMF